MSDTAALPETISGAAKRHRKHAKAQTWKQQFGSPPAAPGQVRIEIAVSNYPQIAGM
jgi:hypothetical protein